MFLLCTRILLKQLKEIKFIDCVFIGNIKNESKDGDAACTLSDFSSGGALMLRVVSGATVAISNCVFGKNLNLNWCEGFNLLLYVVILLIFFQVREVILVLEIIQELLLINRVRIQHRIGYE
jgi:hypothetical protein